MDNERYTHGHHESVLRSHTWRTAENSAAFLLEHLRPTDRVLDVGCGPGTITADLARLVPHGSVVGCDASASVIERAQTFVDATNVGRLSFEVADAYSLPFPDESFDVVFAHQVLQHLADPVRALGEMRRVLRSGGLVAVRDADFGAFAWTPSPPVLDRWLELYYRVVETNQAQINGGRKLKGWVQRAGFEELTVSSSNWTFSTREERLWWGGLWADRTVSSSFAEQALEYELSTTEELEAIAAGFRQWANTDDAVFLAVNGEVLARCP